MIFSFKLGINSTNSQNAIKQCNNNLNKTQKPFNFSKPITAQKKVEEERGDDEKKKKT